MVPCYILIHRDGGILDPGVDSFGVETVKRMYISYDSYRQDYTGFLYLTYRQG